MHGVTVSRCHGVTVRQGGEDLRLDQRIQQLFNVMNGVFASNPATAQRTMRVATYAVVPMTPSVGVIEWVKHTQPIKVGGAADLVPWPLRLVVITTLLSSSVCHCSVCPRLVNPLPLPYHAHIPSPQRIMAFSLAHASLFVTRRVLWSLGWKPTRESPSTCLGQMPTSTATTICSRSSAPVCPIVHASQARAARPCTWWIRITKTHCGRWYYRPQLTPVFVTGTAAC